MGREGGGCVRVGMGGKERAGGKCVRVELGGNCVRVGMRRNEREGGRERITRVMGDGGRQ